MIFPATLQSARRGRSTRESTVLEVAKLGRTSGAFAEPAAAEVP